MSKQGYIKLYRKIEDNPLYFCEPFSKIQAWIDLILLANHKDSVIFIRGNEVKIKRGQVAWSKDNLASRWKWSKNKVYGFLSSLEQLGQISYKKGQQNNNILGLITIINYDEYQKTEQQKGQQKDRRKVTKKNVNNVKNDNNIITSELKNSQVNINPLIELFKETNLTYEDIFKNKTERKVLTEYVEKFGYEKTYSMVEWAIKNQDQYYTVTKPTELKRNINKLIIKYKNNPTNQITEF